MNESDREDERGVGSDSQDQTRIWCLFCHSFQSSCFLPLAYSIFMYARLYRRIQQRPTNEVHIKQYVRSTYPFSGDYVSICGDFDLVDKTTTKSTSRLAAAAQLYTTMLRRRSLWPNKNQSQVTHKSQLFHRFFYVNFKYNNGKCGQREVADYCALADWPGLTTKIQCWIMTIQFLFISRRGCCCFFLFSWLYSNSMDGIWTWRSENRAFNANIHKSAIVGNCATDAQSFSFRSFWVVRRLIKKKYNSNKTCRSLHFQWPNFISFRIFSFFHFVGFILGAMIIMSCRARCVRALRVAMCSKIQLKTS